MASPVTHFLCHPPSRQSHGCPVERELLPKAVTSKEGVETLFPAPSATATVLGEWSPRCTQLFDQRLKQVTKPRALLKN